MRMLEATINETNLAGNELSFYRYWRFAFVRIIFCLFTFLSLKFAYKLYYNVTGNSILYYIIHVILLSLVITFILYFYHVIYLNNQSNKKIKNKE